MSLPPRRRLALTLLAVVALLLLGAATALLLPRSGGPGSAAARSQPGPVLLVPGYGGSRGSLESLARALRAQGRTARVLALPGDGTGDLRGQAAALGVAVREELARSAAASVDLVGYSAGGVVVRLWVADGHADLARRVVTLGSPHHGAGIAGLAAGLLPGSCPAACRQLAPDSALLAGLNRGDETPAGPQWTSVWTELDQTVTPPDSAALDGAVDVALQRVCPDSTASHATLPTDPLAVGIVLTALGPGLAAEPGPAECTPLRIAGG